MSFDITAYVDLSIPGIGDDLGDDDGDGMHNSWELFYGLNPNDSADANIDTDLDGKLNINEYQLFTDPTDDSS